jgi:hypothetical protein
MTQTEQRYRQALAGHDWNYDYSDDHSVWSRGRAQRETLRAMRDEVDASGEIWNSIAPAGHKLHLEGVQ